MKALVLHKPGHGSIETIPEPVGGGRDILLKIRMVGLCGSDLNSFRGLNPLVTFPRIPGHEVSATVVQGDGGDSRLSVGTDVAIFPYTSCGKCASCRRGRPNACQFNQTLGVQRDGALTEFIVLPPEKLYPARLTTKELCLIEPLTVGFHAVSRGRVTAEDTVAVMGCGGVGLGAVAASSSRGARTICIDVDDDKLELARAAGGAAEQGAGRVAHLRPPALRAADDPRRDRPGQPVPAGRRAQGPGGSVSAPRLDMDRLIDDRRTRIIVCCGSGGVVTGRPTSGSGSATRWRDG